MSATWLFLADSFFDARPVTPADDPAQLELPLWGERRW